MPLNPGSDYQVELNPEMDLHEKIEWLVDNECNETGEAMAGLQTFLSYACNGDYEERVLELVKPIILETYDICREEYDYERDMEDNDEQRAETVAQLVVSDMIGQGLIPEGDSFYQKFWIDKIKRTVENFA